MFILPTSIMVLETPCAPPPKLVLSIKENLAKESTKIESILYNIAAEHTPPMTIVKLLQVGAYHMTANDKKNCVTLANTTWFCPEERIISSRTDGQFRVRGGHVLNPNETVQMFDVLGTYIPLMILPQITNIIKHLADAIMVMTVMVVAEDQWVTRWWRTVPPGFVDVEFRSRMAAGVLRQLHNCADYVDSNRLCKEQVEMRLDLLCVLDQNAPYCAHGCGSQILYDIQVMMLKEDAIRPSAAFLCRDPMPGYQYSDNTLCTEHAHPLVMVATRAIPAGRSPVTICWNNPLNVDDENLKEWRHPALMYPMRVVKCGKASAVVTAFDRIEKMLTGSRKQIRLLKYDAPAGTTLVDKLRASIKNLRKRAKEFDDFKGQGAMPFEDWPMPIDIPSYRLMRLVGKMLWILPPSSETFKECIELYKTLYVPNIHKMGWPTLVFDMVGACAFLMERYPCDETRDLYHAAIDEFEMLEGVHETHLATCERIALYSPCPTFYSTTFKIERAPGSTQMVVHKGEKNKGPVNVVDVSKLCEALKVKE